MLALQALVALATALSVAAAPGLTLTVNGADSVTDVDNFQVSTTLTNTGDETLRILNDPNGPLSKLPTDTFSVVNAKGSAAQFSGIKAKYVPAVAAAAGAYTTLAPGESVTVAHDLSEAYNLSGTGADTYEVEPKNLFYLVNEKNEVTTNLRANIGSTHRARISGRLSKPVLASTLEKRATYIGCSSSRQSALVSAASQAQTYAAQSKSYLDSHTSSSTRYTTWFGTFTSARRSTVLSHFNAINGNTFSSFTYDCSCTDSGTYAYVYPNQFGKIWLCGAFWNAPLAGTDSKGGTLVHEASHFDANGGTDDIVYGQTGCKNLANSNPSQAVINADSHEYFAENTPALS
jgi:peptidyl-Lys metalloendopeptidase